MIRTLTRKFPVKFALTDKINGFNLEQKFRRYFISLYAPLISSRGRQNSPLKKMTIFNWIFYKASETNCSRLLARNGRYEYPTWKEKKCQECLHLRCFWTSGRNLSGSLFLPLLITCFRAAEIAFGSFQDLSLLQ